MKGKQCWSHLGCCLFVFLSFNCCVLSRTIARCCVPAIFVCHFFMFV